MCLCDGNVALGQIAQTFARSLVTIDYVFTFDLSWCVRPRLVCFNMYNLYSFRFGVLVSTALWAPMFPHLFRLPPISIDDDCSRQCCPLLSCCPSTARNYSARGKVCLSSLQEGGRPLESSPPCSSALGFQRETTGVDSCDCFVQQLGQNEPFPSLHQVFEESAQDFEWKEASLH